MYKYYYIDLTAADLVSKPMSETRHRRQAKKFETNY